ncbi:unnamed protein product [Notodromas monacha]|uniref:Kinase n=1 Tax=Notodromas monacha TaxID=399045 RepID=A0A7R9BT30_9CRUS|nr:unnamed protein product [Notodromas monacha]CAG0920163.1 unnamed protein product [Notodromas monacha]
MMNSTESVGDSLAVSPKFEHWKLRDEDWLHIPITREYTEVPPNEPDPFPEGSRPLDNQVGGHRSALGKPSIGVLQHKSGFILKGLSQNNCRGMREAHFYETVFYANVSDAKDILDELKKCIPKCLGLHLHDTSGIHHCYLKLEDIAVNMKTPSAMDCKIGVRITDPLCTPQKVEIMEKKYVGTRIPLGISLIGARYLVTKTQEWKILGRDFADSVTVQDLDSVFEDYTNAGIDKRVITCFLNQMDRLKEWFTRQRIFLFFSTSLFFCYDADILSRRTLNGPTSESATEAVDTNKIILKMIDFAHVFPSQDQRDDNFLWIAVLCKQLLGLCSSVVPSVQNIIRQQQGYLWNPFEDVKRLRGFGKTDLGQKLKFSEKLKTVFAMDLAAIRPVSTMIEDSEGPFKINRYKGEDGQESCPAKKRKRDKILVAESPCKEVCEQEDAFAPPKSKKKKVLTLNPALTLKDTVQNDNQSIKNKKIKPAQRDFDELLDSESDDSAPKTRKLRKGKTKDASLKQSENNSESPATKKTKKKKKSVLAQEANSTKTDENDEEDAANADPEVIKLNPAALKENFTVISPAVQVMKQRVQKILPDWIAKPTVIEQTYKDLLPIKSMSCLSSSLRKLLKSNSIQTFFPVQQVVIPALCEAFKENFFRPRDICVSAPTGSGKTLAFVLPIVNALKKRCDPQIRALVILPVHELAVQVWEVFKTYAASTDLKVVLLQATVPLSSERTMLVRQGNH